jgi:hypothetical protein
MTKDSSRTTKERFTTLHVYNIIKGCSSGVQGRLIINRLITLLITLILRSDREVNTFCVGCKTQSLNSVQGNNRYFENNTKHIKAERINSGRDRKLGKGDY